MSSRLSATFKLTSAEYAVGNALMNKSGLCVCGRIILESDKRLVLMTVGTKYDPLHKGTAVMAAYCLYCATKINDVLKELKDSMIRPTR